MADEKTQYLLHPETGELKAVAADEVTPHSRKGWVAIQKAAYDRLVGTGTPNRNPSRPTDAEVDAMLERVQAVMDKFPDLDPIAAATLLAQATGLAR